MYDA
ncbi:Protein of unknown function [Bacillus cytotoxicus]